MHEYGGPMGAPLHWSQNKVFWQSGHLLQSLINMDVWWTKNFPRNTLADMSGMESQLKS